MSFTSFYRPVKTLVLCTMVFCFFSCQNQKSCKLGKPTPIFPDGVSSVTSKTFEEKDNNISTETIGFNNGLKLEIHQDGCDFVKQEFRFELPEGDISEDNSTFWSQKASSLFHFMAEQSKELENFHLWAGAIEAVAPTLKLGERTALDGPFFIKIDRIRMGGEQVLLTVVLSNEPL